MHAVTLKDAELDMERLLNQVAVDAEPAIVVTQAGNQVVVVPLDEYNSWQETRHLLASPANAARLRNSIEEARAGNLQERKLSDG